MKTQKNNKDLKKMEDIFVFSYLDENHEIFNNKHKKVIGNIKEENPENMKIDELVCLRSKSYSFKGANDNESKIKLKSNFESQSEHIKLEEKKCLDGGDYQKECDNYIVRSINLEMFPRKVKKSTIFSFDDKRLYINATEVKHWN